VMDRGVIQQIDTPMNLYRHPANRFVAGFLGSPAMNFLSGTVRIDTTTELVGPHGTLALPGVAWPAGWAGREVVIGVRPEDLHPVDAAGPAALSARVDVVEPVGNEVFLNLRSGEKPLVVRLPPRVVPQPGDLIHLVPDPAMLHVFDAPGGARLEP